MGAFATAALDPIFWLHHCNIDRLWEAWMNAPGRTMVDDDRWLDGPLNRRFVMPDPDGAARQFTPRDTLTGGSLQPTYDDLFAGTGLAAAPIGPVAAAMGMGSKRSQSVDVLGATDQSVTVGAGPARASVPLDPGPTAATVSAMAPIAAGKEVTRLYLQLENVTGGSPSAVIDVFVNLPDQTPPADRAPYRADSLYLFGLDKASAADGAHAGAGLGFTIDITDLAQRLTDAGQFDPQNIDVSIFPVGGSSADRPVTVGRVSVLRRRVRAEE
jgi:tyrosinase